MVNNLRVKISKILSLRILTALVVGVFLTSAFQFGVFKKLRTKTEYAGTVVENFALMDHTGKPFELYRQANAEAVVLVSFGIGCPIVRKNIPLLNRLTGKYKNEKVRFFLIDAELQDSRRRLIEEASDYSIRAPILMDDTQRISKSLRIDRTGEVLILDPKTWKIVFRGPFDDRLTYGFEKPVAGENYMEVALTSFLTGRPIEKPVVPAVGCAISYAPSPAVTYHESIAPLLEKKCANCHRAARIAPTNLWTYNDVKNWAGMLHEVVRADRMPPWEADVFFAKIKSDPALSAAEKTLLYAWLEGGCLEGIPPRQPAADSGSNGASFKADLTLKLKNEIKIPAQTSTSWYYEELIADNPEDIWISAMRSRVANPSIIQHVALLVMNRPLDLSKNIFQPQFAGPEENIYNVIRFNTFRKRPLEFPGRLALRIPKGAYVYAEMHFSASGKAETQNLSVQIKRVKPSQKPVELYYRAISTKDFSIPPNREDFEVTARENFKKDTYLYNVGAHMHWRGKFLRLIEIDQDLSRKIIYSARYAFKNNFSYVFDEPLLIKAGSTLEVHFEYDNSAANPAKIDFNKEVHEGPDAFLNEMAVFHTLRFND